MLITYGTGVHAPTDIALSNNTVLENQPVNTVVGTLSTTDPDAGNTFTYTLVSGTGSVDNASFNISGESLRTSAVFDYATKSSYSIRVRTTDQGGLYTEKVFTDSISAAHGLTVTKTGTGTGTVTSDPAGIDCGETCAFDFRLQHQRDPDSHSRRRLCPSQAGVEPARGAGLCGDDECGQVGHGGI